MAVKEVFKEQVDRLRHEGFQVAQKGMSGPAVLLAMDAGIHFCLAAVLAGGMVFQTYAPLGVALVAGAGCGVCGGAALIGACLGYLTLLGFADGLRYMATAILTFSIAFAFHDIRPLQRPWAIPLVAGALNAATGYVYLSHSGWRTADVIFFLGEILLTVVVGWSCRMVLLPTQMGRRGTPTVLSQRRQIGAVVLLCAVLISLDSFAVFAGLSLGRILAVVLILSASWALGATQGVILGVTAGLALDISALGMPLYAMSFGVSALAASAFHERRRLWAAVSYVLANAAAVLWTWNLGLPLSILYEVFLGSMVFMLLPLPWLTALKALTTTPEPEPQPTTNDGRGIRRARIQLESTSLAFRALCDCLRQSLHPPENDGDVATVFDRAACRVCRQCALRSTCWERDYVTTFNALNDATPAMVARGRGEREDFPQYFSSRCIHFPVFLEAVNVEFSSLLYRRQYNNRIQDSRSAVCRQYAQLSTLLSGAATELAQEISPDPITENRLQHYLSTNNLKSESCIFRDHRNRLHIELSGTDAPTLLQQQHVSALSLALDTPLRGEVNKHGVALLQDSTLMAVAGVAARKKDGEMVSGDSGSYFKGDDGKLYLLLCDGMGSGEGARQESSLAIRLLEQLLRAGVSAEQALITLGSALGLRGEEVGGFTTVDLLEIDLFSGDGGVYKLGAAPTYIKRGASIRCITGTSLPAGLGWEDHSAPDFTRIHLNAGDCVLMVSDGIVGTADDAWLRQRLVDFDGASPKQLARSLITDSPENATDDRTALMVRIDQRPTASLFTSI